MHNQITSTLGSLPFDKMDPCRFEDLCRDIFYNYKSWTKYNHDGAMGKDGGLDIRGETIRDKTNKLEKWGIQCKRYQKLTLKDLKSIIDTVLKKGVIDCLLVVVACNVTYKSRIEYEKYAKLCGISFADIWDGGRLESHLTNERTDLCRKYFYAHEIIRDDFANRNARRIHVAAMKKEWNEIAKLGQRDFYSVYHYNSHSRTKVGFCSPYHSGVNIQVGWGIPTLLIDNQWYKMLPSCTNYNSNEIQQKLQELGKKLTLSRCRTSLDFKDELGGTMVCTECKIVQAIPMGRIPFENMIEVLETGDDYDWRVVVRVDFHDEQVLYESHGFQYESHTLKGQYIPLNTEYNCDTLDVVKLGLQEKSVEVCEQNRLDRNNQLKRWKDEKVSSFKKSRELVQRYINEL